MADPAPDDRSGDPGRAAWSIDELALEAGTTVRNLRLYQERGLLPPPRREGRRGVYGTDHLQRLRLVLALLRRSYPLTAIRELLDAWDARRSLADVLGFEEALAVPFATEPAREVSLAELAGLFPAGDPTALLRAVELGLVRPEEDHFSAPSPGLFDAGTQLAADGVPLDAVLDAAAAVLAATDDLAERFVALFRTHLWQPFVEADMPPGELARITEILQRQRPLATQAVAAALAEALQRHTDAAAATEWSAALQAIEHQAPPGSGTA